MNPIIKFFHELINPHCEHCAILREEQFHIELESRRCRACESFERQIAVLQEQNNKLTEKIVNPVPLAPVAPEVQMRPIHRGAIPFSIIRQQLESESRARAEALRNAALPDKTTEVNTASINIDELENEVMNATISDAVSKTGTK
jgi:hypothetical protein